MPKMDYNNTVIYKLQHKLKDELLYIGHTTNFSKRKVMHKSNCYNTNNKIYNSKLYYTIRDNGGWDEFNMVVIKEFPCKNKQEALSEEDRVMRQMRSSLNMLRAYITEEEKLEHAKIYREMNKEKIAKRYHKYYELNKENINDKRKDKNKEYYELNKPEISEKKKMYREANKEKISEKKKMYREANKEKINEKKKRDYKNNKEKINEKQKVYREANKDKRCEKFNCACGGKYTHEAKTKHFKTKKHQEYLNQQTDQ